MKLQAAPFAPCIACCVEKDLEIGRLIVMLKTLNPTWGRIRLEARAKIMYNKGVRA